VLFSGDVFGCHFCDRRLFNDMVGDFRYAFEYYFRHIMRPFKSHVLDALTLIEPLELAAIAPSHGPILRDRPRDYVARYRELATPRLRRETDNGDKTLVVFYISSYGNTRRMAEAICDGASEVPGLRISLYDLEGTPVEPLVDLVEEADALLIGSPTINGDAVKPVWDLLSCFAGIHVKGKVAGAFGSYGWSGEAIRMIEERLRGLKLRVPVAGLKVKLIPAQEDIVACRDFGRQVGEFLIGRPQAREIDFSELVSAA
jgi:flavorubredoxin